MTPGRRTHRRAPLALAPLALAVLALGMALGMALPAEVSGQARCPAPLVADLARGTLGGVPVGAPLTTWRGRLRCLRPDSVDSSGLLLPVASSSGASPSGDPQARVGDGSGWTIYAGFAGTVRPSVLGLPMRTAVARLRSRGLRVAMTLGDEDPAYALRSRAGCVVLYAEDGRVAQVQVLPGRCAPP